MLHIYTTVESGQIETVANVVTRMTIPSWAAKYTSNIRIGKREKERKNEALEE